LTSFAAPDVHSVDTAYGTKREVDWAVNDKAFANKVQRNGNESSLRENARCRARRSIQAFENDSDPEAKSAKEGAKAASAPSLQR
jgi:hypothetical protein